MLGTTNQQLLENYAWVARLLGDIGLIGGITLILGGFFKLKRYFEMRSHMTMHMTIVGPGMMIFAGVMLTLLPIMLKMFLLAIWGTTTPGTPGGDPTSAAFQGLQPVYVFVRLLGVVAFMRGLFMLAKSGQEGGQQGGAGKALMFMIGGIMCVHIVGTASLLGQLMGFNIVHS